MTGLMRGSRMLQMRWIVRKSVEHQLRNTTYSLRNLVAAADVLTAAWDAGGQPTPEALAEFQRRKNKLSMDMLGTIGIAQLRRVLIEPELDALQAHADARSGRPQRLRLDRRTDG